MNNEKVFWIPGWYELDQGLEVGLLDTFAFWRTTPERFNAPNSLVFFNTLGREHEVVKAFCRIENIHHAELGDVQKIDTCGLDYTIILTSGTQYMVNAEEKPGQLVKKSGETWIKSSPITEWKFSVEMAGMPPLRSALAGPDLELRVPQPLLSVLNGCSGSVGSGWLDAYAPRRKTTKLYLSNNPHSVIDEAHSQLANLIELLGASPNLSQTYLLTFGVESYALSGLSMLRELVEIEEGLDDCIEAAAGEDK